MDWIKPALLVEADKCKQVIEDLTKLVVGNKKAPDKGANKTIQLRYL